MQVQALALAQELALAQALAQKLELEQALAQVLALGALQSPSCQ